MVEHVVFFSVRQDSGIYFQYHTGGLYGDTVPLRCSWLHITFIAAALDSGTATNPLPMTCPKDSI